MISLKDYRQRVIGLTQKEVANLCKVSVKTIERWESSKYQHNPNKIGLSRLAKLYGIPLTELKNTIKGITMKLVDTTPYSVTTRKGGCEVWVSNDTWSYFIGECYEGTSDKTIATVMKHAQVICNALNKDQMEQM